MRGLFATCKKGVSLRAIERDMVQRHIWAYEATRFKTFEKSSQITGGLNIFDVDLVNTFSLRAARARAVSV